MEQIKQNQHLVDVTYRPIFSSLDGKVALGIIPTVTNLFVDRTWFPNPVRSGFELTPGKKLFWLASIPAALQDDTDKIIEWGMSKGFDPANYIEAFEWQRALELRKSRPWIIAPGSHTFKKNVKYIAMLSFVYRQCYLDYVRYDAIWNKGYKCLFVKNVT